MSTARQEPGMGAMPSKDSKRSTKDKILDSAEKLFAVRGYFGASIRQIAAESGVEFSLARYHIGSKDDLFRHVLIRRADTLFAALNEALDDARRAAGPGRLTVEALVDALTRPPVQFVLSGDPGWKSYLQLVGQFVSIGDRKDLIDPLRERYAPVFKRYAAAFEEALPGVVDENVFWSLYFLNLIISQLFTEVHTIEQVSGRRCNHQDYHAVHERLVRFAAGGFRSLAGTPKAKN